MYLLLSEKAMAGLDSQMSSEMDAEEHGCLVNWGLGTIQLGSGWRKVREMHLCFSLLLLVLCCAKFPQNGDSGPSSF